MRSRSRSRRRQAFKAGGLIFWAALVSVVLLWQVTNYRGVIALAAEWQFNIFGRYYPTLTFVLLVVLLVLPGLLIFRRPREPGTRELLPAATLRSARSFTRLLFGIAGGFWVAGAAAFLTILSLPDGAGPLQTVSLATPTVTLPHEGATTLIGEALFDRTVAIDEDLFVTRRSTRFAPIVAQGGNQQELSYFVELPLASEPTNGAAPTSFTGILKRGGLPGELIRLYRYSGARVEEPYFVLFAGPEAMRWPHIQVALQLLLAGAIFFVMGLWQRRRVKRLMGSVSEVNQA
jgi:hypothetical protein